MSTSALQHRCPSPPPKKTFHSENTYSMYSMLYNHWVFAVSLSACDYPSFGAQLHGKWGAARLPFIADSGSPRDGLSRKTMLRPRIESGMPAVGVCILPIDHRGRQKQVSRSCRNAGKILNGEKSERNRSVERHDREP